MPTPSFSKHLIPDMPSVSDVLPYLKRIDEACWYSNFGPLVNELEHRLQTMLCATHFRGQQRQIYLTTLASGYHALEIGLLMSDIALGHKVLMPAVTFSACPLAVKHAGYDAVLADVDPRSWTLTPRIARAACAKMKIGAVMPVAIYGVPLPASEWDDFTRDTGVPVVMDAAAAFDVQQPPQLGLVAYSFHATKPFGMGEGGILVGCDPDVIAKARQYSNFGMINRIGHADGANAKVSEYHAAVGLAQIQRWETVKRRRRDLLLLYREHLDPLGELVSLQPCIEQAIVSCLMLLLKESIADAILTEGKQNELGLHQTYLPALYRHPHFAHLEVVNTEGVSLPTGTNTSRVLAHMQNSERLGERLVGLPFHSLMDEGDVATVVERLTYLLKKRSGAYVSPERDSICAGAAGNLT